jgi:hypothetical protein
MTSTTGGAGGPSFGWLNRKVIEGGVLPPAARRDRLEEHIFVFGGEERFWMGPEGGQFSIFFAPGSKFEFSDWHTPAFIDTEPFEVLSRGGHSARFGRDVEIGNYSGTRFQLGIQRDVTVLDDASLERLAGGPLPPSAKAVAYETDNRVTNRGEKPWTKDTGLLSIWLLGMYKPGPRTVVVIPIRPGPDAELGPRVNDSYFGKVPPEYLVVRDRVLFFKGDGTRRGKIGISPARSTGVAGSYDPAAGVLTLVSCTAPAKHAGYVNSMWEIQKDPFSGDAINSYNDGSPEPGKPPLGPFYELETSSPAADLAPGATIRHVQSTLHIVGDAAALDPVARRTLGVSLGEIRDAFQ